MAETVQSNELSIRIASPLNYIGSQRRGRRSYSVVAAIQSVELELSFPMVQFSSKNIDVSKSYGRNSTEGKWGFFEVVVSSD